MPKNTTPKRARPPLTRQRILRAALKLAGKGGIQSVTMRALAAQLGVEAMSLYNHVESKGDVIDGLVDMLVGETTTPSPGTPWRQALRDRAHSLHAVLLRHPWAATLIEGNISPGPERLRSHNAVIGVMREDGFSIAMAYTAFLLLDSYVYGFTLQEVSWPFERDERASVVEGMQSLVPAAEYPYIAEMMEYVMTEGSGTGGESRTRPRGYEEEFETGLELILDAIKRKRRRR